MFPNEFHPPLVERVFEEMTRTYAEVWIRQRVVARVDEVRDPLEFGFVAQ
jgi:hypothetical protein